MRDTRIRSRLGGLFQNTGILESWIRNLKIGRCIIMSKHRINRISEEVKRVVSDIIRNDLNDPRISTMCSVVSAEVTPDLRYAKVYVSVLGNNEEKQSTMKGLSSAAGFIRRELGKNIELRYSPEVIFELDNSIEHGAYINKLIKEVNEKDGGESL